MSTCTAEKTQTMPTTRWTPPAGFDNAREAFAMGSDTNRLRILLLLDQGPRNGQELLADLATSQPALSVNLRHLRGSALVTGDRDGKFVYNTITDRGRALVAAYRSLVAD